MADFWVKRGDTAPSIRHTLLDGDGNPVDLDGASVRFFMKPMDGGPLLEGIATIEQVGDGGNGTKGDVRYDWGMTDLLIPGGYFAEWQVTYAGGDVETFPNDRHITVAIVEDLAVEAGS